MAKITAEEWKDKYINRQAKIEELKQEIAELRRIDASKMNDEFMEAFGIPEGFRLVKGRAPKKKVMKPSTKKP